MLSPGSTICTLSEPRGAIEACGAGACACAGRHVTRNDHALAGPQHAALAEAVRFHDSGSRHAVFARDALDRFAVSDRDRLAAVPGPVPARRGRRRAMRAHRSGDVGGAGPVSAQALRAGGDALRGGDGGRAARRRQRLRFNAARGRARGDRTGRLLRRRTAAGGVGVGVEACAVRTTGGGKADQSEDGNVRPDLRAYTRARRHVMARHVVTHSYATKVDFEIKQQRVNKVLRITEWLRSVLSPSKMPHTAHDAENARRAANVRVPALCPAITARNAPRSGLRAQFPLSIW